MKKLFETDYIVYDKIEDEVLLLSNGDIAIYGNEDEAKLDCYGNECAVKCTEIPLHWQVDILKQILKN
jgi:beta-galactosidase beta subunit